MNEMFSIPLDEPAASIVRCGIALTIAMALYSSFVLWLIHYIGKTSPGLIAVRLISILIAFPFASVTTRMVLKYYPDIRDENSWIVYLGTVIGSAVLAVRLTEFARPAPKPPSPPKPTPGGGI